MGSIEGGVDPNCTSAVRINGIYWIMKCFHFVQALESGVDTRLFHRLVQAFQGDASSAAGSLTQQLSVLTQLGYVSFGGFALAQQVLAA